MHKIIGNKVVKNASWIIICHIVQALISFVISILTARYLGPENFGLINYAASIVAFLLPIMRLGFDSIIVFELLNNPDDEGKIIGTAVSLNLCSAVLCMIAAICFGLVANPGEIDTLIVLALYSTILVCEAGESLNYWFQAKLMSKYSSICGLVAYTVVAVYKIFLLVSGKSVYWFAVTNSFDYLLIFGMLMVFYKKKGGSRLGFSPEIAKRMLNHGKFYIVSSLMVMIFSHTDRIMLKLMVGNAEAGYYSVAAGLLQYTSFIFTAIISSMRPVILEHKKKNEKNYEEYLEILYSTVIYFSLIIAVCCTACSDLIIRIMYGEEYLPAIPILQVLSWYIVFSYLGGAKDVWILAEEKQKYLPILNLLGAILNIVLNALLIPYLAGTGAAIASLITQIVTNTAFLFIVKPLRRNGYLVIKSMSPANVVRVIKYMRGSRQ